ncbi:MAG: response regulator [Chloroflexota bacterium]|nr:response regulator [Chloroflexota bacterium]
MPPGNDLQYHAHRTLRPLSGGVARTTFGPMDTTYLPAAQRAYVLEDEPAIAALEADLLREMGFSVVTCTRIVELGDLIDLSLPHLLVVDINLPDGNGDDLVRLLHDVWPGIPVIFVTGARRERLYPLRELGPVVEKPFDLDEFTAAVTDALEHPRARRMGLAG